MSRGTHALLDLPSETITILRATGWGLAPAFGAAVVAGLYALAGGVVFFLANGSIGGHAGSPGVPCFAIGHPIAWPVLSASMAATWATLLFFPFQMLADHDPAGYRVADAKFPGLAALHLPVFAAWTLPLPDSFPGESPEDLGHLLASAPLVAVAMGLLLLTTVFTLAPAIYVRDTRVGVLDAFHRSRELARGRRLLFATVAAVPLVLTTAGVFSFAFGDQLTLGHEIFGFSIARWFSRVAGIACVLLVPTFAAALKSAALNLATRPD